MFSLTDIPAPRNDRPAIAPACNTTPSDDWGWLVTTDGRVVRATASAGVVTPCAERELDAA